MTTIPIVLNTDHKMFKYLDEEALQDTGEKYPKESPKERMNVNKATKHDNYNKIASKELKNDNSYEAIVKPAQIKTAKWKSVPKKWIRSRNVNNAGKSILTQAAEPKLMEKQNTRLNNNYDLKDVDYPYNQNLQTISKMMQEMAKESMDGSAPVKFSEKRFRDKVNQQSELNNGANVKPNNEPKESNNYISPQLGRQIISL